MSETERPQADSETTKSTQRYPDESRGMSKNLFSESSPPAVRIEVEFRTHKHWKQVQTPEKMQQDLTCSREKARNRFNEILPSLIESFAETTTELASRNSNKPDAAIRAERESGIAEVGKQVRMIEKMQQVRDEVAAMPGRHEIARELDSVIFDKQAQLASYRAQMTDSQKQGKKIVEAWLTYGVLGPQAVVAQFARELMDRIAELELQSCADIQTICDLERTLEMRDAQLAAVEPYLRR